MTLQRRQFIKKTTAATALIGVSGLFNNAFSKSKTTKITVLHTNDFEGAVQNFSALKQKIGEIRNQQQNVLLFDSGDFFSNQSKYKGEAEYKLLQRLNYNAVGLGNNELKFGQTSLAAQITNNHPPILSSNSIFKNNVLGNKIAKTHIIHQAGIKIGIFSLNIDLNNYYNNTVLAGYSYANPINIAEEVGLELKNKQYCDIVICLSHLGYAYKTNKVSDCVLAEKNSYIDLILGGHTHTNLEKATRIINQKGNFTVVNQAGSLGNTLGSVELTFEHQKLTVITDKNYWLNN